MMRNRRSEAARDYVRNVEVEGARSPRIVEDTRQQGCDILRLDNLVLLCGHHHRTIHQPGWTTTFDGHTLTVTRPDHTTIGTT